MQLAAADYFNLATFRKNGNAVATPVWFAPQGDTFYVFSAGDAGKVKRIRSSGRVRVAACDVRGQLTGEWTDAQARLVNDPAEVETAYRSLRRKYGLRMATLDFFAKLSGRYQRRQMIAVNVTVLGVTALGVTALGVTAP